MENSGVKAIAFYLPQYHPIPENDKWWGKGFTEWTNVTKAKPLFRGHYQPRLPSELGFYDLRVPEVRFAQAQLAKEHGIYGFCYWHYWFGNGRRILERPFNEVLQSGEPDFPFCLAWANESWSGIWHGLKNKILMEQLYPGKADYENHFNLLLSAFEDKRYIRVNNKPLFIVYMPEAVPDLDIFVDTFQNLAIKNGLDGLHLVATNVSHGWDAKLNGFDAITLSNISKLKYVRPDGFFVRKYRKFINEPSITYIYKKLFRRPTHIYNYREAMNYFVNDEVVNGFYYPMAIPCWDNSARSGLNSFILKGSTPDLFKEVLRQSLNKIEKYPDANKIIFIKSWNEWAEGNYIEPDVQWGRQYLEAVKEILVSL